MAKHWFYCDITVVNAMTSQQRRKENCLKKVTTRASLYEGWYAFKKIKLDSLGKK